MERKILLPTDFSRNAWDAIAYAVDFFKNEPCHFYILHVFDATNYASDNSMTAPLNPSLLDVFKHNSEKGLEKVLQLLKFRDDSACHTFTTLSERGIYIDITKQIVRKYQIDMIVMGSKGESDVLEIMMGSTILKTMEKIRNCPILAVPPGSCYSKIDEIVFPCNFKVGLQHSKVEALVNFCKLATASLALLYVAKNEQLDEVQLLVKSEFESIIHSIPHSFHFIEGNSLQEVLSVFVQSRNSGMVAFINKKHSVFTLLFSTPLVKELKLHSKVPFLALPQE